MSKKLKMSIQFYNSKHSGALVPIIRENNGEEITFYLYQDRRYLKIGLGDSKIGLGDSYCCPDKEVLLNKLSLVSINMLMIVVDLQNRINKLDTFNERTFTKYFTIKDAAK